MINVLYSFIGCFFSLFLYNVIFKRKTSQIKNRRISREIPPNYGKFADPLGEYENYKDKNNLYKTYVLIKKKRGE